MNWDLGIWLGWHHTLYDSKNDYETPIMIKKNQVRLTVIPVVILYLPSSCRIKGKHR